MKICLCVSQTERQRETTTVCLPVYQHPYSHCCYVYIPRTTCLHIPLAHPCLYYYLSSPQYTVLHILLFILSSYILIFLPIFMFILLCCVTYSALSVKHTWPDLTYISLLIIFCIFEYVTNKNLDIDLDLSYPVLIVTFFFHYLHSVYTKLAVKCGLSGSFPSNCCNEWDTHKILIRLRSFTNPTQTYTGPSQFTTATLVHV